MSAYEFTIRGPVVPYVRMTRRGKFVKASAKRYLASQESMQWQFVAEMDRNGWEKFPAGQPLHVTIAVRYIDRRSDLDNVVKAILDAANGIVWEDDRWVDSISAWRYDMGGEKEIAVQVKEVQNG